MSETPQDAAQPPEGYEAEDDIRCSMCGEVGELALYDVGEAQEVGLCSKCDPLSDEEPDEESQERAFAYWIEGISKATPETIAMDSTVLDGQVTNDWTRISEALEAIRKGAFIIYFAGNDRNVLADLLPGKGMNRAILYSYRVYECTFVGAAGERRDIKLKFYPELIEPVAHGLRPESVEEARKRTRG